MTANFYTHKEVEYVLGGCEIDGSEQFRRLVGKAFKLLPSNIVDFCEENVYFLSLQKENRAAAIYPPSTKKAWIILVDSSEFEETDKEVISTILHEIGHTYLGHKGEERLLERKDKEEDEVNKFTQKYLK